MLSDRFYTRISTNVSAGFLRAIGRWNVPVYRLSRGHVGGKVGKAPVLLLTTTGRKSGQQRTAPVVYGRDGANIVVIGSNAGNSNEPGWSYNLRANPEATIEIGAARSLVRARVAEGEERERLWKSMNLGYEGFDDYAARTDRDIPLFVLESR